MADEKTHRPKISVAEKDAHGSGEPSGAGAPGKGGAAPDDGAYTVGDAVRDGGRRVSAWVRRTFPGQEKAFWGAVIGLLAAIVFLVVGPWPLVVIAVFVFVGVAAGQALDGDPRIFNTLRHLFNRNGQ